MAIRKEIIVLNGGGHKGVVKISGVGGRENYAKINCSLDFRPSGAFLYIVGDNIAKMPLNDVNCEFEVPFCANSDIGCVVRSSSLTMFGGRGVKSEMLARIDKFNKEQLAWAGRERSKEAVAPREKQAGQEPYEDKRDSVDDASEAEENSAVEDDSSENVTPDIDGGAANDIGAANNKAYVGVSAQSEVNPLGEWTKYDGNNFYYAIKPQIDEMFICYPEEKLLGATVPNSKWVRVDAEDGYYVVGLLYDEDVPSYICYGVPQYPTKDGGGRRAPAEMENMCVWLPLADNADPEGYWMIYQSAKTGEIIK